MPRAHPSPRDLREARVPAGSRHLLGPELTRGAAEKSLKVSILNELRRSRGKGSPASSSPYFSGLRNVCLPQQDKVPFISWLGRFDRLGHPQIPLRRRSFFLVASTCRACSRVPSRGRYRLLRANAAKRRFDRRRAQAMPVRKADRASPTPFALGLFETSAPHYLAGGIGLARERLHSG